MKNLKLSILAAVLIGLFSIAETSAQTRISFVRDKSSATISGSLSRRAANGSIKKFVVAAKAGQHLSVVVKSAGKTVYANMSGADGERGADFYYTLDTDGDHEFMIENVGSRAAKYTIVVSLE